MDMPELLVSEADGIVTLTLNRPARRNALTPALQDALIAAFEAAAASATARVVVLTGAGEAFCAGLDISVLQGMADSSAEEIAADAGRVSRLFRTLYELPLPTIAAVNGAAVAGGTGLATLCDFTLALPGARFGYTEVRIGFVPAMVSAYLTLQVGEKRARDLLLTGRLFSADEAVGMGLVNEVVDDLSGRTAELCGTLIGLSPGSLRATKGLLVESNRAWLDEALAAALRVSFEVRGTGEFREGVAAFLEKRKPVW